MNPPKTKLAYCLTVALGSLFVSSPAAKAEVNLTKDVKYVSWDLKLPKQGQIVIFDFATLNVEDPEKSYKDIKKFVEKVRATKKVPIFIDTNPAKPLGKLNEKLTTAQDIAWRISVEDLVTMIEFRDFDNYRRILGYDKKSLFKGGKFSKKGEEVLNLAIKHLGGALLKEQKTGFLESKSLVTGLNEKVLFKSGRILQTYKEDGKKIYRTYKTPEGVVQYRIPSLVSGNGKLFAAVTARHSTDGDNGTSIGFIRKSLDGGKTWSEMSPITPMTNHTNDATLAYNSKTEKLHCFYKDKNKIHHTTSKDDGKTWTEPTILKILDGVKTSYICVGPGKGILTSKGEIMFSIHYRDQAIKGNDKFKAYFIYTNDDGKTWNEAKSTWGNAPDETCIVELSDGKIMSVARNVRNNKYRQVTVFDREIGQWTEPEFHKELTMAGCQGNTISIPHPSQKGKKILLYSGPSGLNGRDRSGGVVRVSLDDGKTWPYKKDITVRGEGFGYSVMTQLKNGDISLLYETNWYNNGKRMNITYTRFTLDWLTDGKIK